MSDRVRRIKGLSDKRRMPRLGKIRLGIKAKTSGGKEFPRDVEYFVLPDDDYGKKIAARYGDKPTELDILFPVDDDEAIFPQALAWYGGGGLRCRGDGSTALRTKGFLVVKDAQGKVVDDARSRVLDDDGNGSDSDLIQIGCPCPLVDLKGGCGEKAHLLVMLPEISVGGVFQIDTGSINNIINLNSQLEYVRTMMGRIALVPLKLKRVAETISYADEATGQQKKSTHYLLRIEIPLNLKELVETRMQGPELALRRAAGIELPAGEPPMAALPAPAVVVPPPLEPTDAAELAAPAVETHDPVTGEIHPVSGDDEPFPGVPMKPAAKPGDVLTDEQVDRFVVRMCELLGVDDSAGPVSAMIRIEDELRARRAPFSLGQVDKLTRSEARTIVQWAEAAAKQHTAVEVSEGPASATTGAVHQAAQGSGAVMAGRDRPGHASNLGQGPATVPASTATHSADAHVSNGADPGQSFPTATATAPPADHPLTDEQRARLDAAKERGRGKGRA